MVGHLLPGSGGGLAPVHPLPPEPLCAPSCASSPPGRGYARSCKQTSETTPSRKSVHEGNGGQGTYRAHMASERSSLNRTQRLVLGFFVSAWAALIAILVAAPKVYDQALRLPGDEHGVPPLVFLAALSTFLLLLGVGVVRRWRWTFWLVFVAFVLGGVLRLPLSVLELVGVLPAETPAWYALLQAFIGVVQFAIGLAMLTGYRREGVWGSF